MARVPGSVIEQDMEKNMVDVPAQDLQAIQKHAILTKAVMELSINAVSIVTTGLHVANAVKVASAYLAIVLQVRALTIVPTVRLVTVDIAINHGVSNLSLSSMPYSGKWCYFSYFMV